jgi:ElaB/YqjD/DUF883 family membrane-anchored ribosome-binding protein
MAQDDKRLPEGTDKIIAGSSATGAGGGAGAATGDAGGRGAETVTADTTLVTEKRVRAPKGDAERPRSGSGTPGGDSAGGGEGGGSVIDKLRSGREKISGQAADKARGFVHQGLERSSEALTNVGKLVSETASGLDERLGPEYGDYARRAGSAIEDAAQRLATKDPDELIDDTREFVRKSPGVALAGAAIVGFALARLIKSGLDRDRGEDEDERA